MPWLGGFLPANAHADFVMEWWSIGWGPGESVTRVVDARVFGARDLEERAERHARTLGWKVSWNENGKLIADGGARWATVLPSLGTTVTAGVSAPLPGRSLQPVLDAEPRLAHVRELPAATGATIDSIRVELTESEWTSQLRVALPVAHEKRAVEWLEAHRTMEEMGRRASETPTPAK